MERFLIRKHSNSYLQMQRKKSKPSSYKPIKWKIKVSVIEIDI